VRTIPSSIILSSLLIARAFSGAIVSTAGCGGGSNSSGGSAGSGGSGGAGGAAACFDYSTFDKTMPTVSYKTDVLPIFQRSCGVGGASCHGDPNASNQKQPFIALPKAMMMTADDIKKFRAANIGVASFSEPDMSLIAAGDPEHSFLMYKLDFELKCSKLKCGTDCGDGMPRGNDNPLAQNERDAIRRWIAQGAQDN
jgi:hypothetical protein